MHELRRVESRGERDEGYWRNVLEEFLRSMCPSRYPLDKTIYSRRDDITDTNVARTKDGYVVKCTNRSIGYEYEAMKYVHKHSAMPMAVPLAMVSWGHCEYMIMTYVPGQTLKRAINEANWGYIEVIKSILPKYVRLLHSIPLPQSQDPQSLAGLWDFRGYPKFETEFISTLNHHPFTPVTYFSILRILEARAKGLDDPVITRVITHGHLHPENIIVDGTRISGIIDWEYLRIAPTWWEMLSIWYRYGSTRRFRHYIPKYVDGTYTGSIYRWKCHNGPLFMLNCWQNHPDLLKTLQVSFPLVINIC
jgi:aminoglycoside phosphotransferase (APT) family kinase protein